MIGHVVTKNQKNVERMKEIVIKIVIANLVSSVEIIIVQVVSHQASTAAIIHQVLFIIFMYHELDLMSDVA